MPMDESLLRPHSIGVVVFDKDRGSDEIKVLPIEKFNILPDGRIDTYKKDYKGDKQSLHKKDFDTAHESRSFMIAKWLPFGESNRVTAPDVYKNETVFIYKYADVEEYYWFDVMREPALRKLEDVVYCFSNVRDHKGVMSMANSYWMRWNTRDKIVQFHTADTDGEAAAYDIIMNGKSGTLSIKDNKGNQIDLNSKAGSISLKAKSGITLDAPSVSTTADFSVGGTITWAGVGSLCAGH